ncbi:MAG: hypothetical protein RL367_697 [Pseudomonadota bacterium]
MGRVTSAMPEALLALLALASMVVLSFVFSLPISLPDVNSLLFTGMSVWAPVTAFGVWWGASALAGKARQIPLYVAQLGAYLLILVAHFNTKLWMTAINPHLHDRFYMDVDQAFRPVIDVSFAIHRLVGQFGWENKLYLFAFLAMYVCSIIVHSFRDFLTFRKMVFASMLIHVLGGIGYLIAPAIGPFLYEQGLNAIASEQQQHMINVYHGVMQGGAGWISKYGPTVIMAPPAAMPSLHVASSAIFVWYAWKHERWLCWGYIPLFAFIIAEAMATRWHYLIDIAFGLGLTAICLTLCELVFRPRRKAQPVLRIVPTTSLSLPVDVPVVAPVPAVATGRIARFGWAIPSLMRRAG